MNNRIEKGFRAALAAGILLFSGCLESPRPIPPAETLPTRTPMADSVRKGGDPYGIAMVWVALGGAGTALAGFFALRRTRG